MQAEVRALAQERGAVILAHNYQVPGGAGRRRLRRRFARPLAQGRGRGGRGDRVLRRALHGRDGLDPVPGEDRADPRPRRRVFARGFDRRRAADRLEGAVSGGSGRDVREHDRRGEGADRLLLHVGERGGRRQAHLRDTGRGHRDPVRPRHVAGRVCGEGARQDECTCGTASATSTRASARRTSRPRAPRTPTPTS